MSMKRGVEGPEERMVVVANLLVTSRCTIACEFCLNVWKDKGLSIESARSFVRDLGLFQLLQVIDRLHAAGIRYLVLTGGEPLLHPHLAHLISYAHDKGFSVRIQTNGELLSRSFLQKAKGKLATIQVSLEGTKDVHNAITQSENFDKVVKNMRLIKEVGIPLSTNFTIVQKNKDCLHEYVNLLGNIGVLHANFTPLYPAGMAADTYGEQALSDDELRIFLKELHSIKSSVRLFAQSGLDESLIPEGMPHGSCGALVQEVAVQPNGDVTMCPGSSVVLGNILKEPLADILENEPAQNLRNLHSCEGCMLMKMRNTLLADMKVFN